MNRKDKDRLNIILSQSGKNRFCKSCNQEHGWLYMCPKCSKSVEKIIENDSRIWLEFLTNKRLIARAIRKGVRAEAILFWQIFAGIR